MDTLKFWVARRVRVYGRINCQNVDVLTWFIQGNIAIVTGPVHIKQKSKKKKFNVSTFRTNE